MTHPDLSVPAPAPPPASRRFRIELRHLMIGIAILAVVLALAIQLIVLQRRAAELDRWGQSLRERERYLRRMDDASKQATQKLEGLFQDNTSALEGALRDNARQIERYRQVIRGMPPRTVPARQEARAADGDDATRADPAAAGGPEPGRARRSKP